MENAMDETVYVGDCHLGKGVFAMRDFREGERIFTLVGPVITFEQSVKMGEKEANLIQIDDDRYIDPASPGRYLNHSCNPNAGTVNGADLIAIQPISEHEEIRIDYSTTMQENHWTMECRCGEGYCRKIITDFRLIPKEAQRRYLALGVVQDFICKSLENKNLPPRREIVLSD
jgi:hypothetical protein